MSLSLKKVDYIIVGSGPAGSILARKLSDNNSVLLLEAGPYAQNDPLIKQSNPLGLQLAKAQYFWEESTIPQQCANNLELDYTGGRVLGGSSSINGGIYFRGSRDLYEIWQQLTGDDAWSPDNVVKFAKQFENYVGSSEDQSARGHGGLLDVRQLQLDPNNPAFPAVNTIWTGIQAASTQAGVDVPTVLDPNVQPAPGVPSICKYVNLQITQKTNAENFGERESAYTSMLEDIVQVDNSKTFALGKNGRRLTILFSATALNVIFNGNKAKAVSFLYNGKQEIVRACKKVILSAGINTPQLLQNSGVGNPQVLANAGIPTIINNPNVGARLHDHPSFQTIFAVPPDQVLPPDQFTTFVSGAFLPDPRPGKDKTKRAIQLVGFLLPGSGIFILIGYLLNSKSVGSIPVIRKDPLSQALPDYNILCDPDDVDLIKASYQTYVLAFINAVLSKNYFPVQPTMEQIQSDQALTDFIRRNIQTSYHYGESVRMATLANGGAVDSSGRVYGARNLIVADNSIQPIINNGNTQFNSYLIGWKIAQDILFNK